MMQAATKLKSNGWMQIPKMKSNWQIKNVLKMYIEYKYTATNSATVLQSIQL